MIAVLDKILGRSKPASEQTAQTVQPNYSSKHLECVVAPLDAFAKQKGDTAAMPYYGAVPYMDSNLQQSLAISLRNEGYAVMGLHQQSYSARAYA